MTEYGIADLRGQTDATVIERILNITDSRFQSGLIEQAQKAGKLPKDFRLDPRFTDNTPERLKDTASRYPSLFTEYPLGCDFTAEERDLLRALNWLKSKLKLTEILELGKATPRRSGPRSLPRALATHAARRAAGLARRVVSAIVAGRIAEQYRACRLRGGH